MVPHQESVVRGLVLLGCLFRVGAGFSLSAEAWVRIERGGVHVEENFLPADLVTALREDAEALHELGRFRADGLFRTTSTRDAQGFEASADRQTLKMNWREPTGDLETRLTFQERIAQLRAESIKALPYRRSALEDGEEADEIAYNFYMPGASLRRHLDESHEGLKGARGWALPTRRCLTWLVYLNDDWTDEKGGNLRCYERQNKVPERAGSSTTGDVQVGWLRERPVFLGEAEPGGDLFLYAEAAGITRLSNIFPESAIGGSADLGRFIQGDDRFEQLSSLCLDPKNAVADCTDTVGESQRPVDISPRGGKLVIFDSVVIPHEVLAVTARHPRIAATGWFHAALPQLDF